MLGRWLLPMKSNGAGIEKEDDDAVLMEKLKQREGDGAERRRKRCHWLAFPIAGDKRVLQTGPYSGMHMTERIQRRTAASSCTCYARASITERERRRFLLVRVT